MNLCSVLIGRAGSHNLQRIHNLAPLIALLVDLTVLINTYL